MFRVLAHTITLRNFFDGYELAFFLFLLKDFTHSWQRYLAHIRLQNALTATRVLLVSSGRPMPALVEEY